MFNFLTNTNCMEYAETMNCLVAVIECNIELDEIDQNNMLF